MGRIMKCRNCDEVLVCSACGVRQTPVKDNKKKTTSMSLDPETLSKVDAICEKQGISRSEYFQNLAEDSLD